MNLHLLAETESIIPLHLHAVTALTAVLAVAKELAQLRVLVELANGKGGVDIILHRLFYLTGENICKILKTNLKTDVQ